MPLWYVVVVVKVVIFVVAVAFLAVGVIVRTSFLVIASICVLSVGFSPVITERRRWVPGGCLD